MSYDSVILDGVTEELWTLGELADRVATALSSGYAGQASSRVTEVPDVRTIRYYTTLGLLDRPSGMRGRTALYAPRHLWQLVAIKRLQADGRSLAEIQAELAGAPDATLRRIADLPETSFWRRPPVPPQPVAMAEPTSVGGPEGSPLPSLYQAVPLAGGAMVLIPSREPLRDADIAAIRAAARALDDVVAHLPKGSS